MTVTGLVHMTRLQRELESKDGFKNQNFPKRSLLPSHPRHDPSGRGIVIRAEGNM